MAAGGNITLFDYSMGVPFNGSCPNALLAGGDINFLNGFVRGNIVAGGETNLTYISEPSGCTIKANIGRNNVYDFDGATAYIKSVSSIYGTRPATKPLVRMYDQVTLQTGVTANGVSVFSVPSSLLAGCSGLNITAPAGQLVLINIPGENNTIADFAITLAGGVDAAHVLWNFYNSTVVTIDSVAMIGTVLAPFADVYFNAGDISGGLYANSITGTGELHGEVRLRDAHYAEGVVIVAWRCAAACGPDLSSLPRESVQFNDGSSSMTSWMVLGVLSFVVDPACVRWWKLHG
jgi:choice-of-anchor A domain-containing protein